MIKFMNKLFFKFSLVYICLGVFGFFSFFAFSFAPTYAISGGYLRVITDDTPFYQYPNQENCLFYLPYTYYVKVLGEDGDMLHVECFGDNLTAIDGYVPSNLLFDDDLTVVSPYVDITLTTAVSSVLYSSTSLDNPIQYVFAERQMQYYGSYKVDGQTLYYVGYNGRLGYVKESDVYPFEIVNHPNELSFIKVEEPPLQETPDTETLTETPTNENDFFSLKVIIVVCLLFAGIVALFVALKTKPQNKTINAGYYDENDYE